ncbi:MAG: ABC transporter ATP-binding protein [Gaiellales bacterium]
MTEGIHIHDVSVTLGGRRVLDDVSLQVDAGARVAFVGASGVGKTTLLRALAGLVPIEAGRITIDGRDVSRLSPHERRLGMVFQEPRLLPHLSALDNVALPLRARRMSRTARRRAAWNVLEQVGVSHRATGRPSELSGGEQQRVALARALVHDPSVLILDEPLSAVDAQLRVELQQLILTIQREFGMTMLLVTHDRDEASTLGASTAVMVDGRVVQHAPHSELALRPATPDVARLIGSGCMIEAGAPVQTMLSLAPDRDHWVPAPALTECSNPEHGATTSTVAISARVTRLRLGSGGWIASIDVSGTAAQLAVAHGSLAVGDEMRVLVDCALITEFEAVSR